MAQKPEKKSKAKDKFPKAKGFQGYNSMHWLTKHAKMNCASKYGGFKEYTMKEVKLHNKDDDCWLIINGHIFDVTEYIPYHPGGKIILKAAGKDGTRLFLSIHRWVNLEMLMKNCYIGKVKDYVKPNLDDLKSINRKQIINSKDNAKRRKANSSRAINKSNLISKNKETDSKNNNNNNNNIKKNTTTNKSSDANDIIHNNCNEKDQKSKVLQSKIESNTQPLPPSNSNPTPNSNSNSNSN